MFERNPASVKSVRLLVLAALATSAAPALAAGTTLTAMLAGANETAGGNAQGSGTFKVEADVETGDFCYTLTADKIGTPTMAHLHAGAAGKDGDVVVPLTVTGAASDECVAIEPDKLKPILADPAGFYINVHTAEFPNGAIRGQLVKP